jgi:hypothetical protein
MLDLRSCTYNLTLISKLKGSPRDSFLPLEVQSSAKSLSVMCRLLRSGAASNARTWNTTISPLQLNTPSNASTPRMKILSF